MKFFSYVDIKDRGKLIVLFFISLITNIFELCGIGLIPTYVFAISSFEELENNSFYGLHFLSSLTFDNIILLSSFILVCFFVIKNIVTIFFYKVEIRYFTEFVSNNASKLFKFYLEKPYSFFEKVNPSEIIKNISVSNNQAADVLKSKIIIIKELVLILFVFLLLLYVDPITTFVILFF